MFAFMKMLSDVNELYLQIFPFYFSSPPPHARIHSLAPYVSSFPSAFSRLLSFHNILCYFISLFHQMRTIWQLKIQRKKLLYWPPTVLFCFGFFSQHFVCSFACSLLSILFLCVCVHGHRQWEQHSDADNNLVWWGHAHHMKYVKYSERNTVSFN